MRSDWGRLVTVTGKTEGVVSRAGAALGNPTTSHASTLASDGRAIPDYNVAEIRFPPPRPDHR
jgi:hypothetical protein